MIREIAIAARDFNHARQGDVIVCREPLGHIGDKEDKDYIWIVSDVPADLCEVLTQGTNRHKRRYALALDFDRQRASNRNLRYQPFVAVNEGSWRGRPILHLGMAKALPDIRTALIDKKNHFDLISGMLTPEFMAISTATAAAYAATKWADLEKVRDTLKLSRREFAKALGVASGLALLLGRADTAEAASARRTGTSESISTYGVSRNYSALSTWEAATDNDNVATTVSPVLECYDDAANFNDSVTLDGSTNNSTYFRIVRPAAGQGHDGTSNNGVYFKRTSDAHIFYINETNTQVQNLILTLTINNGSQDWYCGLAGANNVAFVGCLAFDSTNIGATSARGFGSITGNPMFFILCLAENGDDRGMYMITGTSRIYNCTVRGNANNGVQRDGAATLTNVLSAANGADFNLGGSGTVTYCASSDATADDVGGTGNRINQTFTFANVAGNDFHLAVTDAGARNFGTSLSGDGTYAFDDDIDGQNFSTWDIGFDEPESQSPAPRWKRYYDMLRS